MLQIYSVLHYDQERIGPLKSTTLAVFHVELVANHATVCVVIEIDWILEHFAVQCAQACLPYQSKHFRIGWRRLAYVADLRIVVIAYIMYKGLFECTTSLSN